MIGLDTNVLVRYLVQDDPVQSNRANRLIETAVQQGNILWICLVTLCETIWVLNKCYKLSKEELLPILEELLLIPQIKVENDDVVRQALRDYEKSKKIGFPDCLIGRQNLHRGCSLTYTFDKAAVAQLPTVYKGLP